MNIVGNDDGDYQTIRNSILELNLKNINKISFQFNKTITRGSYKDANVETKNRLDNDASLSEGKTKWLVIAYGIAGISRPNPSIVFTNYLLSKFIGETSTFNKLHQYCQAQAQLNQETYVLYAHNIGGSSYRKATDYNIPNQIASKREYLNSFIIEHPSICLRALYSGYSTCGVGLHNAEYLGHYFWANCKYVTEVPAG